MTVHMLPVAHGLVRGRFNPAIPPVLTIESGDTVVFETLEPSWGAKGQEWFGLEVQDIGRDLALDVAHAVTGPVAINGAAPGDVLEISIGEIQPGAWGWTWSGPVVSGRFPYRVLTEEAGVGWRLDSGQGRARDIHGLGLSVPLRPFMGVMGVCPAGEGDHPTGPPRRVGGNLDCRELVSNSILWLPVEVPGALFSVGDGHGAQGDGEIAQTAIECPMERVVLTFQVRKDLAFAMPRAETPAGTITFGLGADLDEATAQAIAEMLDVIQERTGLTRPQAAVLSSAAVSLRITQVVNGVVGVHAILSPDSYHHEPT